jgi:hypothetical protein
MSPRRTPHRPRTSVGRLGAPAGSFWEARDTGNSNRVLGLFRSFAKGVK